MKFTLNWLKNYIDFDLTPAVLAERLTMAGLEVDAVAPLYPDLTGVKVARILQVHPHPNADRLVLCDVEVGDEIKKVVCGAPNARAGLLTAIALPGVKMPEGFTIKASKIRGEASEGMLCSASELGISSAKTGIMELAGDLKSGQDLAAALELDDTMVEVDLTPNRADCASVIGIAREVGGFTGNRVRTPVSENDLPKLTATGSSFSVEVNDAIQCPRYAARMIRGVKIAPSPWWLQRLLLAVGLRPINNVVDITNFVLLEYGQPLHAFDFKRLAGGKIVVRTANTGEKMVTLDGVERQLDSEMLLICDAEKPVAVAGVMGAENSEVTDETTDILLEAAYFEPVSIRRTAGRLNLSTDSSYRFERGVDPQGVIKAQARAVALICELAGGVAEEGGVLVEAAISQPASISLRVSRCADLLGVNLSAERITALLESIEIPVTSADSETLTVSPPTFRVDLEREVDLVEEVARLHGYNDLPTSLPLVPMSYPESQDRRRLVRQVLPIMTAMGFFEAINYSFGSANHFDMLGLGLEDGRRRTVNLLNPLAEDQSIMRSVLLPGLLENLRRNLSYQTMDVRLFEVGKVFTASDRELPDEEMRLAGVMTGRRHPGSAVLYFGQDQVDIFDVKGVLENLFSQLRLPGCRLVGGGETQPYLEDDCRGAVMLEDRQIGIFGRIAGPSLKSFGIKQEVYYFDCSVDGLLTTAASVPTCKPLPRFPSVRWDIAMLVPEDVPSGELLAAINGSGELIVEQAELFDVYRGKNIEDGYKSVAVSITYRDSAKTLDDDTVGKSHQKIISMIENRFGGRLREI